MVIIEEQAAQSTVTSPTSGIVTNLSAASGVEIKQNTKLLNIVQINPILAEFELASHEAKTVQTGQNVNVLVRDLAGERFVGTIRSVSPQINESTGTITASASVANPSLYLKSGMIAEIEFKSTKHQRYFVIPAEAIITTRRQHFVFTVIKGKAHRIRVVPKETRGELTEIVEGLREDDLVVVKGHQQLEEGMVVDIWR